MKPPITCFAKRFLPLYSFNVRAKSGSRRTLSSIAVQIRKGLHNDLNPKIDIIPHIGNDSDSWYNASPNALQLFDELSCYDVVSATSLLGDFAKQNRHQDVICYYSRFLQLKIMPNEYTFGTVLHSVSVLKDLNLGKQLQASMFKTGLTSNVFAGSAILCFYVKLSKIDEARKVFEEIDSPNVVSYTTLMNGCLREEKFEEAIQLFESIPKRNVVSWNALISGFSQKGKNEEAVNLFVRMLRDGVVPSHSTFPCVIIAAANLAAIGMGRRFHACALKFLGNLGVFISNSLVSFYAKCGEMEDSVLAFSKISEKNVISWNAVICGYAQNGHGEEAIYMFEKMKCSNIWPNDVTLLGLLLACNHSGLVDEGCSYFNQAKVEYPDILKAEHYACVVDLLSRSGRFKEAEKFVTNLPFKPGIGFWKAILGGCQNFLNVELGELAIGRIMELDPRDVSSYVMLSNAHSAAGRWQNVSAVREEMREKGLNRIPGCSWIEIKSQIHVFVTGDQRHAQKNKIYEVLRFFLWHGAQQCQDITLGPES